MAEQASGTRTVERAMSILECFDEDNPALRISDIARQLDLSKATVYRLLKTLEGCGYVTREAESEKYRLGVQALRLGKTFLAGLDFRRIALPAMKVLRDDLNESVNLFVSNGKRRIVVERIESTEPLRRVLKIGDELPLERGAAGKVFLAHEANRRPGKDAGGELIDIRRIGYALSHGERTAGASSVAVPLFDHRGEVVAVLAIAGPTLRFQEPALGRYIATIVETGAVISKALGYSPSASATDG